MHEGETRPRWPFSSHKEHEQFLLLHEMSRSLARQAGDLYQAAMDKLSRRAGVVAHGGGSAHG